MLFRSAYAECHALVDTTYKNPAAWNRKAILNVARMGKFSADRVIQEYAQEIWEVAPVEIDIARKQAHTRFFHADQFKKT